MTLEEVIKLRPHHASKLFKLDLITIDSKIRQVLSKKYNPRMINNVLRIKQRVLQCNTPIILVPSQDDVCHYCNRWRREEELKELCFEEDSSVYINWAREDTGMESGKQYEPINVLSWIIGDYESKLARSPPKNKIFYRDENPRSVRSVNAQEFYRQKIEAYSRLYEHLRQVLGR